MLELGRRTRPRPYELIGSFEPVIPRELRVEVTERMTATGEIYRALDEEEVASAARALLSAGAEAVVIHFIHSYANPAHELHAADIVRTFWPNQYVTVGHEIIAEYREYERGVTAAVNGAVQPVLHRYIERLEHELSERGYQRGLLIMRGNGGTASSKVVTKTAVHTVMSGPASGVIAAAHIALAAGHRNVVTYDMGGTSTDVALVQNGIPLVSSELELEYAMPIHVPMVDVHTVGAGGGSIAHVNEAGLLQIGPESAGAIPGPICFGRGGVRPTITDANLVLGRLNKDRLLGVKAGMDLADVTRAIDDKIGQVLDLDVEAAAAAILRVANDKMAGAIRLVSLARGHDPRDFALLAFGGAGPLHATALARELGIPDVLIPARPGLTNAFGCLVADLRHDFVRTVNKPLWTLKRADLRAILDDHVAEGRRVIGQEAVALSDISILHAADMQFEGQNSHPECRDPRWLGESRLPGASLRRGILATVSRCSARDQAGPRQPAHGGHRPARPHLDPKPCRRRSGKDRWGGASIEPRSLVRQGLARYAGVRARPPPARERVPRACHPRAARCYDHYRTRRLCARRCVRECSHQGRLEGPN